MFDLISKSKKKKNNKKREGVPWFKLTTVFVLGIILVFLLVQMYQFVRIRSELAFIDSLETNTATVLEEMSTAKNYLTSFGSDLNQIREYLLLPTKEYDFSDLGQGEYLSEDDEEDLNTLVFTFVDRLGDFEEKQVQYEENLVGITEFFVDPMWAEATLFVEGFKVYDDQLEGMEVLDLYLDLDSSFTINSYNGEFELVDDEDLDEVKEKLTAFVEGIEEFRNLVRTVNESRNFVSNTVIANSDFQEFIVENKIGISEELELVGEYYYYSFYNDDGVEVTQIWINKDDASIQMYGDENEVYTYEISEEGFAEIFSDIKELDFRTSLAKTVDEKQAELEALFDDNAFMATLEDKGFTVTDPEDTDDRFSFSILDSEGNLLRTVYLDKSTGEVLVETPEESTEKLSAAIDSLDLSSKKTLVLPSSLPEYSELVDKPGDFTVLLMGKHGSNVDTIMFAYVDVDSRKVTLISIPRDLYVNDRKINSVYADYGVYEQVRWVEEAIGYEIDKFVLIDMYVFRDVIDLMGGIDVTLSEDLIDPTYKTCDDGVCSTLYYEAGDHHLDGTEALRIARSRHTTSDYSRAARQQLILQGVQEKANNLSLGDADTVLSLISTVVNSTETNISLDEAVRYYFTYQNFYIASGYVLSTGNVLETVKVPVDYTTSLLIDECLDENNPSTCEETYAIYTLSPLEGNWDSLRWYVSSILGH